MTLAWTVLCPGAAQGVAGARRAALGWAAAGAAGLAAAPLTVWGLALAAAARAGSLADAIARRRRAPPARLAPSDGTAASLIAVIALALASLALTTYHVPSSGMHPALQIGDRFLGERVSPAWRAPARGDIVVFRQPCEPPREYVKRVVAVAGDTVEIRCGALYVNGAAVPSELVAAAATYDELDEATGERHPRAHSRYRETLGGRSYDVLHAPERPGRDAAGAAARAEPAPGDYPALDGGAAPGCGDLPYGAARASEQAALRVVATSPGAPACAPQRHAVVPPGSLFVLGDNRYNSNDSRYWGAVPVSHVTARVVGVAWPPRRFGGR